MIEITLWEVIVRNAFSLNNTGPMRRRKWLCDLAARRVCRRPELWKQSCCFSVLEGRENRVGRYLGLMPGVDVRHQDKNQRKFSGEKLWLAIWLLSKSQVWRESRGLPHRREGKTLTVQVPIELGFYRAVCEVMFYTQTCAVRLLS